MIAWVVCSVCFAEIIIDEYPPPYSRIGCVTDPFLPRHTTLRHRVFTRSPSRIPAQDQPSPSVQKPPYIFKWVILSRGDRFSFGVKRCRRRQCGASRRCFKFHAFPTPSGKWTIGCVRHSSRYKSRYGFPKYRALLVDLQISLLIFGIWPT